MLNGILNEAWYGGGVGWMRDTESLELIGLSSWENNWNFAELETLGYLYDEDITASTTIDASRTDFRFE